MTTTLQYTPTGDALKFSFKYDAAMVAALKAAIPSTDRRFDWDSKTWIVSPDYEDTCRRLALQFLGNNLSKPQPPLFDPPEPQTELIELRYLGSAKDRGGDERTAYGHDGKAWRFIFPENVLKQWFGIPEDSPDAANTLYAVLGVRRDASKSEIKTAYRAAARQWHPDVCQEDNATSVFQRINEAYEVLSDKRTRDRYDAGLALSATTQTQQLDTADVWRAPLRCGYLLVTAIQTLGRLRVSEIHQWTDIVHGNKTLVTTWKYGDDTYRERWV
jgi:hypothetical protein